MMAANQSETVRLHAVIEGRVQGVGFRYYVEENARILNLTGWVRNRWDGSVETVAESDRETLEKFLLALRRGPRSSQVSDVTVEWLLAAGEFNHFTIKMTE